MHEEETVWEEEREIRQVTDYGSTENKITKPLNIQTLEKCLADEKRVVLRTFLQALQRRSQENCSLGEIADFSVRNLYSVTVNVVDNLLLSVIYAKDLSLILPSNFFLWKLALYSSFFITGVFTSSYLLEFLKIEYMPHFSREEHKLYQEYRSITHKLPKKLYIPFFFLTVVLPAIFAIAGIIQNKVGLLKIAGILLPLPIYLGICFLAMQILGKSYLRYGLPMRNWVIRVAHSNNEYAIMQARTSLAKHLQKSLQQRMKAALKAFRMDSNRNVHYQKILRDLDSLGGLTDLRDDDIFQHVSLLESIIKAGLERSSINSLNSNVVWKKLFSKVVTFGYCVALLFFLEIGTPIFWEESYGSYNLTSFFSTNLLLRVLDYAGNVSFNMLVLFLSPFLFQKTLSFFLYKAWDLVRCFFRADAIDLPVIIQQRRYAVLLGCLVNLLVLIFSLPGVSFYNFPSWLLQGYNNEFSFSEVQYKGENSLISTYFPFAMQFFVYSYPLFRLSFYGFKRVMWYLSNEEQRCELKLERYLKIFLQLIKACKIDSFLGTMQGISKEQLQNLFGCENFESLLEISYRQKGVDITNDKLYQEFKKDLLNERRAQLDEEGEIQLTEEIDDELTFNSNVQREREMGSGQFSSSLRQITLTPQESIKLVEKIRQRELKNSNQRDEKGEDSSLLPTSPQHTWLSSQWCHAAKCTLY